MSHSKILAHFFKNFGGVPGFHCIEQGCGPLDPLGFEVMILRDEKDIEWSEIRLTTLIYYQKLGIYIFIL